MKTSAFYGPITTHQLKIALNWKDAGKSDPAKANKDVGCAMLSVADGLRSVHGLNAALQLNCAPGEAAAAV